MYKLIVNADDFGLNDGVSRGILKAMQEGIVTSTSIMMNMPSATEAIKLAEKTGLETFGIHLTLTSGRPVLDPTKIPSLVNEEGIFIHDQSCLIKANNAQIEEECRGQLQKFFDSGLKLSHIDTHHHIHGIEEILPVFIKLAHENNVPIRNPQPALRNIIRGAGVKTTDVCDLRYYGSNCKVENLKSFLASYLGCNGTVEFMCHPGIVTDELRATSGYSDGRAIELETLTSGEIKRFILENKIILTNFTDL